MRLGIAEIGARVGGLIRQGSPLCVVLNTLCQLFDATVERYVSSILLLDRTGARVRNATGPGLPASYIQQLEGRRVSWIETKLQRGAGSHVLIFHPLRMPGDLTLTPVTT